MRITISNNSIFRDPHKVPMACLQCDRNINGGDNDPNINLDELSRRL